MQLCQLAERLAIADLRLIHTFRNPKINQPLSLSLFLGICSGWANEHYMTFDGTYYHFKGNCSYVLVKPIQTDSPNFWIHLDNYYCSDVDGNICSMSLFIFYNDSVVLLTQAVEHGKEGNLVIHFLSPFKIIPIYVFGHANSSTMFKNRANLQYKTKTKQQTNKNRWGGREILFYLASFVWKTFSEMCRPVFFMIEKICKIWGF